MIRTLLVAALLAAPASAFDLWERRVAFAQTPCSGAQSIAAAAAEDAQGWSLPTFSTRHAYRSRVVISFGLSQPNESLMHAQIVVTDLSTPCTAIWAASATDTAALAAALAEATTRPADHVLVVPDTGEAVALREALRVIRDKADTALAPEG